MVTARPVESARPVELALALPPGRGSLAVLPRDELARPIESSQVVLAPEGVPTISVSYVTFLAPLMLWIGSALFAWRLSWVALSAGRRALAPWSSGYACAR